MRQLVNVNPVFIEGNILLVCLKKTCLTNFTGLDKFRIVCVQFLFLNYICDFDRTLRTNIIVIKEQIRCPVIVASF